MGAVVPRRAIGMVLCGLGLGSALWAGDAVVRATEGNPGLGAPAWAELDLEARKLFLRATSRLSVRLESSTAVQGDLRAPPRMEPRGPSDRAVAVVSLSSDLPFGRFESSSAWIDPATGAALQGERLNIGRKPSWKLWRYLDGGKYVWRAAPADKGEEVLDRSAWTRLSERFEAWEGSVPTGLVVSDSYALLYLVSAARLDQDRRELSLCIEAGGRLVEVRFISGELVTGTFELEQVAGGRSEQRKGEIRARAVRGIGQPVSGGATADDVDLGFLGLKGEITILLEEGTGVPLEVRGRAEGVGRVTVRVRRVVLAGSTRGGGG